MKQNTVLILGCLFFFRIFSVSAQHLPDSVTYWVNTQYLAALDSGKSVEHCEKQSIYLLLDFDSVNNKLLIVPAIQTSWESFSFTTSRSPIKENFFFIADGYGMDSGSFLRPHGKNLALHTRTKTFLFRQIKFLRIEKEKDFDMREQISRLNAQPLLSYLATPCANEKLFFTRAELADYYSKGMLSISCSDDFNYNELSIKGKPYEFFLVYGEKTITLYKIPPRDRGEPVDVSKLKECEVLYKTN